MKSIEPIPMHRRFMVLPKSGFVDRWGALPLLCWLSAIGMPLQRNLEVAQVVWTSDAYAATLAVTSSAGTLQSIPFVLFMASIYSCAGLMLMRKLKLALSIFLQQWPLLLLLLFVAASMLWSASKDKALINIANNLGVTLIALAAALRYRATPWLLPKHIAYVLGCNVAVHLAVVFLLPSYSIDWEGRWRGLTDHPNVLGGIAFCTFWANTAVMVGTKNDKYHLHLLFAVFAVVTMLGANSMTSIISSICALVSIYVMAWNRSRYRDKRLLTSGIGMGVLVVVFGIMLLGNSMDLEKLLGLAGRSANFTGRTDIWMLAIDAISASPWVGWGFDGNYYLIKATGMPYTSYHNGYLDLAVCGGLLVSAIFFLILGNWSYQVTQRTRLGSDIGPFAIPFVIAMLIYNLMEANFVAPRNQMWIIFLVTLFLCGCKKRSSFSIADLRQSQMALTTPTEIQSRIYARSSLQ